MNKKIIEKLIGMSACDEGVEYARSYRTMQEAWDRCERGDWMLWLLGRLVGPPESKSRKKLVLAACACARLSLDHIPAGEQRPLTAIEMAEAWARGQDGASLDDVRRTASAASAYAYVYASAAAATAYAATATAYVYASAAAATASAYAAYARKKTLLQCAEIVRSMYPKAPGLKGEGMIQEMHERLKKANERRNCGADEEIASLRAALAAKDAEIERLKRFSRHPDDIRFCCCPRMNWQDPDDLHSTSCLAARKALRKAEGRE